MEIHPDFKELLKLFAANNVDYVIVGGYALAFHGAVRFTGDIDLFVKPDTANSKRIMAALDKFGFGSIDLNAADFQSEGKVIQLGVPPVRVDIMTGLTGVTWQEAADGKMASSCGDVQVFFIGKKEIIVNKRALGRKKDLADLEALGEK